MPKDIIPEAERGDPKQVVPREQFATQYCANHSLPAKYDEASKKAKSFILDAAQQETGYHRKSLIRLLKRLRDRGVRLVVGGTDDDATDEPEKTIGRPAKYLEESGETLRDLAELMCMSERKIWGSMARWIPVAQKLAPIDLTERVIEDLLGMSSATIGRFLRGGKESHTFTPQKPKPKSKHQRATPLRTWADWRDLHPGALQVDSVAHAGGRGGGGHLWTVTVIDVYSGWTDAFAIHRLTQEAVADALERMRERSPFRWFSVHTDNGSEFLERGRGRLVQGERLSSRLAGGPGNLTTRLTSRMRTRPSCGSWWATIAMRAPGRVLCWNDLYAVQRSISNFFEARQRLIGKRHKGRRTTRIYDKARIPDARLLDSGCLDQGEQEASARCSPISTSRTCCPRRMSCSPVSIRSPAALSSVVSEAPRLGGAASRRPARPLLFMMPAHAPAGSSRPTP